MKAEIGSISEGTLRMEDLIPRFLEAWKNLDDPLEGEAELIAQISSMVNTKSYFAFGARKAAHDLEILFVILDTHSPVNCYFGTHPGDGSDFGWWSLDPADYEEDTSLESLEEIL